MRIMKLVRSVAAAGILGIVVLQLSGCGAAHTAIKKRNLDVQTRMSETIFLEPMAASQRVVFVDIRNTSDKEMNLQPTIARELQMRGYTVTNDPQQANYVLQANVLQVGKADLRNSQQALDGGFGGAVVGATAGYAISGANRDVAVAGLVGAALGVVGDALVEDTYYTMVTDVQIRERPSAGEVVTQTQAASIRQGTATSIRENVQGIKADWKTYRTRVVSTANKMNLEFEEAQPALQEALAKSLSGLF